MSEIELPDEATKEHPARPGMVDWYGPVQLIKTGGGILLSTLLGSMIDSRRFQTAEGSETDSVIDYSGESDFTFDYMADTGDGWNSTYSMAYLLTSPDIDVEGLPETLSRAEAVILGGDEVYPVASKQLYASRLVSPFNQVARDIRKRLGLSRLPRKDIYLIPGNHDWYDSLGAFSRRFFAIRTGDGELRQRELGQFKTRQVRSYFVLKLPQDWEIWALDIQLTRDFDNQQFEFFNRHARSIEAKHKIILCVAEPEIVYGKSVKQEKRDLVFGIDRISRLAFNRGARVMIQLAGDVHNYQHYAVEEEKKDKGCYARHHIVSGGGGAFLHPTHSFHRDTEDVPRITPEKRYPEREVSKKLANRNLLFPWLHKGMAVLLGAFYTLMFWSGGVPKNPITIPVERPGVFLLALIALVGSVAFTGFGTWRTRLWGLLHGACHIALAVLCWHLGPRLGALIPMPPESGLFAELLSTYLPRIFTFVLGGALGGTLFGLYLWCSLNLLRIHHNEGFSSICSPHYKNFLRCTVRDDGSLLIRALGVARTAPEDEGHPVKVHLIEEISIPAA